MSATPSFLAGVVISEVLRKTGSRRDVDVVRAHLEARADHRVARIDKRPGRVKHQRHAVQGANERRTVAEFDRDRFEAELPRERLELGLGAPGEHRAMARRTASRATSSPVYPYAP